MLPVRWPLPQLALANFRMFSISHAEINQISWRNHWLSTALTGGDRHLTLPQLSQKHHRRPCTPPVTISLNCCPLARRYRWAKNTHLKIQRQFLSQGHIHTEQHSYLKHVLTFHMQYRILTFCVYIFVRCLLFFVLFLFYVVVAPCRVALSSLQWLKRHSDSDSAKVWHTLCLCPPLLYSVTVTGVCPCSHADTVGGLFVPVSTTYYLERSQVETFDSTDQLG